MTNEHRNMATQSADDIRLTKRLTPHARDVNHLAKSLPNAYGRCFVALHRPCPSPMSPTAVALVRTPIFISPTSATSGAPQQIGVNI